MSAAPAAPGAFPWRGAVGGWSAQRIQSLTSDEPPIRLLHVVLGCPTNLPIRLLFDGLPVWHALRVLFSPSPVPRRFLFEPVGLRLHMLTRPANPLHFNQPAYSGLPLPIFCEHKLCLSIALYVRNLYFSLLALLEGYTLSILISRVYTR